MASVRQLKTGKWEVTVRHAQLPKGRKFFTFIDEAAARTYGKQWDDMIAAGLAPPASLLERQPEQLGTFGVVLRHRANADDVAPTDQPTLTLLITEIGNLPLDKLTYDWTEGWVRSMKLQQHLAPSSIRKRVGAASRALDGFLRKTPSLALANPFKLLPKRYSAYTEKDAALLAVQGKEAKTDVERDRRLEGDEESRIVAALRGEKRPDKERALGLPHGDAMRVFFLLIVFTGLRLKEAYTLRVDQVDLKRKVIRAKKSKLWHGAVAYKDVPIQPALHAELKAWMQGREGLLFPFWDGIEPERLATNRLSAAFAKAFEYAKCVGLTEHDLRHEATCRWLELKDGRGHWLYRVEEINRIMGWAPNSKMAQRYASFRGESLAERLWA